MRQVFLEAQDIAVSNGARFFSADAFYQAGYELLDITYGHAALRDQSRGFDLLNAGQRKQRSRMSHIELAVLHKITHRLSQTEQPHEIRHSTARAAHHFGCFVMRDAEFG